MAQETAPESAPATLKAHHVLEFPGGYKRSVGPVISKFLTGLRDGKVVGVKLADGRVLVPPTEYDPITSEPTGDVVEVGPGGIVTSYSWIAEPRPKHPLQKPFAWALIRFDGADTSFLHAVDVADESAISAGLRVTPKWKAERSGHVKDIECFVPEGTS